MKLMIYTLPSQFSIPLSRVRFYFIDALRGLAALWSYCFMLK